MKIEGYIFPKAEFRITGPERADLRERLTNDGDFVIAQRAAFWICEKRQYLREGMSCPVCMLTDCLITSPDMGFRGIWTNLQDLVDVKEIMVRGPFYLTYESDLSKSLFVDTSILGKPFILTPIANVDVDLSSKTPYTIKDSREPAIFGITSVVKVRNVYFVCDSYLGVVNLPDVMDYDCLKKLTSYGDLRVDLEPECLRGVIKMKDGK